MLCVLKLDDNMGLCKVTTMIGSCLIQLETRDDKGYPPLQPSPISFGARKDD